MWKKANQQNKNHEGKMEPLIDVNKIPPREKEKPENEIQKISNTKRNRLMDSAINDLSALINALNNKTRLAMLGLLYIDGERNFAELIKSTSMNSNKLSYHINILIETKMIKKINRDYGLTMNGLNMMNNIGFLDKIEPLRKRALFRTRWIKEDEV